MNQYVTGAVIKQLREKNHLTQADLAKRLAVSDKTVSKWETGRGYPDITLLESIAAALNISVIELLSGNSITNRNRAANMQKTRFYTCPVCGMVVHSTGEALIGCCGITLPPLEAEEPDGEHEIRLEQVENEWYVTLEHPMTKDHFISFLAAAGPDRVELVRLYPEGDGAARFRISGTRFVYACCNRHGLFRVPVGKAKR